MASEGKGARPIRAALWFGLAIYVNSAVLLAATPFLTRLLRPSEYGTVTLYNSWSIVIGVLATLSLSSGVFNAGMLQFEEHLDEFVSSMLGLMITTTIIVGTMISAVLAVTGNFIGVSPWLLGYMFLGFIFAGIYAFWQARERFYYRYKAVAWFGIVSPIIAVAASLVIMAHLPEGSGRIVVRIVVPTLPTILFGMVLLAALYRKAPVLYSMEYWRYALGMSIPLIPHYFSQALLQQIDRIAVSRWAGAAEVGVYGLAAAIASGVTLFWTAVNTTFTPWLLRKFKEGDFASVRSAAAAAVSGVAVIAIGAAALSQPVVSILAPKTYAKAAEIIPILGLAAFFQFAQTIYLTAKFFERGVRLIATASVISGMAAVTLNIILVPRFGSIGAASAIAATQFLQLCIYHASERSRGKSGFVPESRFAWIGSLVAINVVLQSTAALPQWAKALAAVAAVVGSMVIGGVHGYLPTRYLARLRLGS